MYVLTIGLISHSPHYRFDLSTSRLLSTILFKMPGPTEASVRSRYVKDIGAGLGPFVMGLVDPSSCSYTQLMIRYVFNMVLLGVLFAQVWHWRYWTIKERPFISVIVVCLYTLSSVIAKG